MRSEMRWSLGSFAIVGSMVGCGPSPQNVSPTRPELAPDGTGQGPTAAAIEPPPAEFPVPTSNFKNPGGMWMPEQVAEQADVFKNVGFQIDAALFSKPTEAPLGAVISLGGCSASFVSDSGLIVTNHHCVIGALQYNSTKDKNLMEDGFYAKTKAEEPTAGPLARVFVTQAFTDVTAKIRDGLEKLPNDMARYKALEDRQKVLVAACEKDRPGIRCSVASYFGGASWRLIEQLEIRDVRLVYAPPAGIGNYGGEIDNWRWPRHSGDFSFYRAYVGKDGVPADFATTNVPYKPKHFLKVARSPLRPGDAVMVAGYPARTNRLTTAMEAHEAVTYDQPYILDFTAAYLKELEEVGKTDKDVALKAETLIRGLANWQTNTKGQLEGLTKGGLEQQKAVREKELQGFIDADPARKKKYGGVLAKMNKLVADSRKKKEADAISRELFRMVRLVGVAHTIVRNAEERPKPDAERDPDYQERNQARLVQSFEQLERQYSAPLDKSMLRLALARDLALPKGKQLGIGGLVAPKATGTKETAPEIASGVDALYQTTKLGEKDERIKLLKGATLDDLKKSKDPMIQLALKLRPITKEQETREKQFYGATSIVRNHFVDALKEQAGGRLAPDANRTLRVTFGTVRGYKPTASAPEYFPFTKASEVAQKHTGKDPFIAPPALLEALKAKRFGPYVSKEIGEVPVDFLSDLDITGGNSGSATLNAKGELVGLAFDGNYESMASDWLFMPEITRTIHVDARYMLWVLDAVSKADPLLVELGVKPQLD